MAIVNGQRWMTNKQLTLLSIAAIVTIALIAGGIDFFTGYGALAKSVEENSENSKQFTVASIKIQTGQAEQRILLQALSEQVERKRAMDAEWKKKVEAMQRLILEAIINLPKKINGGN